MRKALKSGSGWRPGAAGSGDRVGEQFAESARSMRRLITFEGDAEVALRYCTRFGASPVSTGKSGIQALMSIAGASENAHCVR
jgi:hypothetical protein